MFEPCRSITLPCTFLNEKCRVLINCLLTLILSCGAYSMLLQVVCSQTHWALMTLTSGCARLMHLLRRMLCTIAYKLCMRNQRDPNRTPWLVESSRSKRRGLKVASMAGARSLGNANPLTQFAGANGEHARWESVTGWQCETRFRPRRCLHEVPARRCPHGSRGLVKLATSTIRCLDAH